MEIPESVEKIMVETTGDQFAPVTQHTRATMKEVVELLRGHIDFQNSRSFEEGLAFYKKDGNSDKNFIKNLLLLYCDSFTKAIQASEIDDEYKSLISNAVTSIIKNSTQDFDVIYNLASTFNKGKNILDVQKISYIMLGYVIDTIKKIQNTKN